MPMDQRRAAQMAVLRLAQSDALCAAIANLKAGRLGDAEAIVRRHLQQAPDDVAALCLLGDLAGRSGVHQEAERLFRLALARQPFFTDAQFNLAKLLALRDGVVEAIALLDDILTDLPTRIDVAMMRLALLGQIGDYVRAEEGYGALLKHHSDRADIWLGFGHLAATVGKVDASIAAFWRAIALDDSQGAAWWGLANLKTYRFSDAQVEQLEGVVARLGNAPDGGSATLHFALAKALHDRRSDEASFSHYVLGNRLRRAEVSYDGNGVTAEVRRSIAFFTPGRLATLAGAGDAAPDPIFIVGLPRSGSTLVEQILASHPLVEGTSELPYIPMLVHQLLAERWGDKALRFPDMIEDIPRERLARLGQDYLQAAAVHRREGRPFFIDKLPNNWRYIGLISIILPRARIIDARREPMACLWSNYRQWFARGQEFTYDLEELAVYYRDYVRLMGHFDAVLPGRVRRLQHEQLVAAPEAEIRRLLADLDLPFDAACLNFHENERAVRTASAQQVRRPIEARGNEEWRRFEPLLSGLQTRLDELLA